MPRAQDKPKAGPLSRSKWIAGTPDAARSTSLYMMAARHVAAKLTQTEHVEARKKISGSKAGTGAITPDRHGTTTLCSARLRLEITSGRYAAVTPEVEHFGAGSFRGQFEL